MLTSQWQATSLYLGLGIGTQYLLTKITQYQVVWKLLQSKIPAFRSFLCNATCDWPTTAAATTHPVCCVAYLTELAVHPAGNHQNVQKYCCTTCLDFFKNKKLLWAGLCAWFQLQNLLQIPHYCSCPTYRK